MLEETTTIPLEGEESAEGVQTPEPASKDLTALATKIKAAHARVQRSLRTTLENAIKAGDWLIEAKAKLGHGDWLDYLRESCGIHQRVAARYMALARNKERFLGENGLESNLTLAEAARLIVEAEKDEDPDDGSEETLAEETLAEVKGEQEAPSPEAAPEPSGSRQPPSKPKVEPVTSRDSGSTKPVSSKDQASPKTVTLRAEAEETVQGQPETCIPFTLLKEAI